MPTVCLHDEDRPDNVFAVMCEGNNDFHLQTESPTGMSMEYVRFYSVAGGSRFSEMDIHTAIGSLFVAIEEDNQKPLRSPTSKSDNGITLPPHYSLYFPADGSHAIFHMFFDEGKIGVQCLEVMPADRIAFIPTTRPEDMAGFTREAPHCRTSDIVFVKPDGQFSRSFQALKVLARTMERFLPEVENIMDNSLHAEDYRASGFRKLILSQKPQLLKKVSRPSQTKAKTSDSYLPGYELP